MTGLLLGLVPFTPLGTPTSEHPLWLMAVVIVSAATLLSTASAFGSLALARSVAVARRPG